MKPFIDLLARYPGRRLQISERDYDMAREELRHQDAVPLIDPALAQAIIQVWEGSTKDVSQDASSGREVLWIEIHRNGDIEPVFRSPLDQAEG